MIVHLVKRGYRSMAACGAKRWAGEGIYFARHFSLEPEGLQCPECLKIATKLQEKLTG